MTRPLRTASSRLRRAGPRRGVVRGPHTRDRAGGGDLTYPVIATVGDVDDTRTRHIDAGGAVELSPFLSS